MHSLMNIKGVKSQRGATLIVALVLLAAMTILGVSNMQSSSLEMKMVTSAENRNKDFAIAEGALVGVEALIEGGAVTNTDLFSDVCETDRCFSTACTNGLCFEGAFESADTRYTCSVDPDAGSTQRTTFWRDRDLWETATRYRTITVGSTSVKYIIEFLCFVDNGSGTFGSSALGLDESAGNPLFRVTVLSDAGLAPVMLQSTYTPSNF